MGRLLAVAALAALVGASPSLAVPKPACWRTLFVDWADGQITGTYPVGCYRSAIGHVESDRLTYGSSAKDISHLLNLSVARLPAAEKATLTPSTLIAPLPQRPQTADATSAWTWKDGLRVAVAALLAVVLLAWTVARLRRG